MFERSILAALVALAAACGDDGGEGENNPHVLTTCDATTGFAGETCEFACATTVDTDDIACNGRAIVDGAEAFVGCGETFMFGGARGCCREPMTPPSEDITLYFWECQ